MKKTLTGLAVAAFLVVVPAGSAFADPASDARAQAQVEIDAIFATINANGIAVSAPVITNSVVSSTPSAPAAPVVNSTPVVAQAPAVVVSAPAPVVVASSTPSAPAAPVVVASSTPSAPVQAAAFPQVNINKVVTKPDGTTLGAAVRITPTALRATGFISKPGEPNKVAALNLNANGLTVHTENNGRTRDVSVPTGGRPSVSFS